MIRRIKQSEMKLIRPKIKRLYREGISPVVIARQFGISRAGVYKTVVDEKGQRGHYKEYTPEIKRQLVALYQGGMSCSGAGMALKVSTSEAYRIVNEAGVMRSLSESRKLYFRRGGKAEGVITFVCKICGQINPLSNLTENRRYRPPIICCKECA